MGYDAEKACVALPSILNLAQAGGMDLARASDMVTDSMSALGIEATNDNLTSFGDKLAKASQKSNTSVSQLGDAILTVGGTAKNLKGGTTELATSLGILADSGIKASEGGTAIRNIIQAMTPTTDAAVNAFKSLGVQTYDSYGNLRGLDEIFTDLNQSMDGMTNENKSLILTDIFNKTDLKSASALMAATATTTSQLQTALSGVDVDVESLGISLDDLAAGFDKTQTQEEFAAQAMKEFGLDNEQAGVMYTGLMSVVDGSATRWNELSGYIADSDGAMAAMADTMNDNLKGRITEFKSATEGLQVAIYENIAEPMKDTVKEVTGWVSEMTAATETGGLEGLFSSIGEVAAKAVNKIVSSAPTLINAGISLIQNLLTGIQSNQGTIVSGAAQTLTSFVTGMITLFPQILTLGGSLILQFAQSMITQLPSIINTGSQTVVSLINGLSANMPQIFQIATTLIQTLAQGIVSNLPAILQSGITLILNFAQGIINMIPTLAQIAIQLIPVLIQGIVSNLPAILQTGVQLIVSLIEGLSSMIPTLVESGIQLIGGLIDALLSINWLDVGIKIVTSIGEGIIGGIGKIADGIKGLFTGEKETVDIDTNVNVETPNSQEILNQIDLPDLPEQTLKISEITMPDMTNLQTDMNLPEVNIEVDTEGFQTNMQNITTTTDTSMNTVITSVDTSMNTMNTNVDTQLSSMNTAFQTGMTQATTTMQEGINTIKNEFNNLNLYESGKNIMNGLLNGINSKKEELINTAKSIASSISNTINKELDIHSPSRVTFETGKFVALGAVEGMKANKEKVGQVGQDLGKEMAFRVRSGVAEYKPESNNTFNKVNSNSTTNHHYNANFNLTINGNTKDKATERTIKKWIKEGIDEYFKSIGRTSPNMQEV